MALSHEQAREVLRRVFRSREQRVSERELQAVQAIAHLESNYGARGNNWGSVQCSASPPCPPGCMELTDTHADGTKYQWCYKTHDTPEEGAAELVRQLYRREGVPEALLRGSALEIAEAMRATKYFEASASKYGAGIDARARIIGTALGEGYLLDRPAGYRQGGSSGKGSGGVAGLVVAAVGLYALARLVK